MAQNVYDDEAFFDAYARLARQRLGLDGAPEWPTMRAMMPSTIAGANVLDLGCGYGWICRWAEDHGAARVVGVDVSQRMLERAAGFDDAGRIEYVHADLDRFVPTGTFDLVVSSLTFHYLVDLEALLGRTAAAMPHGGRLVFSCEHPVFLAPSAPRFVAGPNGREWALSRYHVQGPRRNEWLGTAAVEKQHRRIDTYFGALRSAGFTVTDLVEWGPDETTLAEHPEWADELERPMFLLMAATRVAA